MEQWHSGKTVEPGAYLLCLPFLKIEEVQRLKKHHEHISLTQVHQLSTQVDALTRVEVSSTVYKNVLLLYCLSGLLCASSFCHPPSSCFFLRLLLSAPPELMHSLLLVSLYLYRSSTFPPPPFFFIRTHSLSTFFVAMCPQTSHSLITSRCLRHIYTTHTLYAHTTSTFVAVFVIPPCTALQTVPQSIQCALFQITFVSRGAI